MNNLTVFFTNQIDSESKGVEVYHKNTLIANGHLNLCSNMAHINILKEQQEAFEDMEFDIEKAIEERDISQNRILIK